MSRSAVVGGVAGSHGLPACGAASRTGESCCRPPLEEIPANPITAVAGRHELWRGGRGRERGVVKTSAAVGGAANRRYELMPEEAAPVSFAATAVRDGFGRLESYALVGMRVVMERGAAARRCETMPALLDISLRRREMWSVADVNGGRYTPLPVCADGRLAGVWP